MIKKEKPLAKCTRCGYCTDNVNLINQSCPRKFVKKGKCKGIYQSMLSKGDWDECKDCSGQGVNSNNNCSTCEGYGWICVRKN